MGHATRGLLRLPAGGGAVEEFGDAAGLLKGWRQVRWVAPARSALLLATAAGVASFSLKERKVTARWTQKDGLGSDSVRWVGDVRGGTWAATIFGASRLLPGGRRWKTYKTTQGLIQDHVYRMVDDGTTLWASCINGGLVRFEPRADRWAPIPQVRGLGNKYIYAMGAAKGALWLGTAGGINLYVPGKGWDETVCADGFTEYCAFAVLTAGDDLWFGTTSGLYHRSLSSGRQERYTSADGLQADEVVGLAADGGTLYVATKAGVVSMTLTGGRR